MTDKDRGLVIDCLEEIVSDPEGWQRFYSSSEQAYIAENALTMLKELKPKTGHWTTKRNKLHDGEWYCDQCDYEPTVFEGMPYCASCGAKMEIGR